MEVKERKLENATVELEITVPVEEIAEEYNKTIKKIQKRAKVDGFRAGKAPLHLVEKKFSDKAKSEMVESVLQSSYVKALTEKNHRPISQPKIDFEDFSVEKPFKYKALFEVYPTVELKDYKNIAADEKQVEVKDEDVEFEIDSLREKHAEVSKKEDGASVENGDLVKIGYKRVDNLEDEGNGSLTEMTVVAGKSDKDHEFDKYVEGMKVDEEKTVKFKYPKDYQIEDLANKKVEYLVKIYEISKRILPEADDEFAKDLGDHDTIADMREKIGQDLNKYVTERAKSEVKSAILEKIIEKADFDIPQTMVDSEKEAIFRRLQQRMGVALEDKNIFAQAMGMTLEDFEGTLAKEAIQSIKTTLVLSEISNTEKLEVSDEEYEKSLQDMADRNKQGLDELKKLVAQNNAEQNIKSELIFDKAMDFIYDNAKIKKLSPVGVKEFLKK